MSLALAQKRQKTESAGSALLALTVSLMIFALYSVYSYFQYKHFVTPSWDLGIFSQLAQAYANGQAPIVPIKGPGFNLWGDHFHPILIFLTPFYFFFPSPATLLYVQNALLALSVFLFCRYAQRVVSTQAAMCFTLAYALSFGIQQAVSVQFHEVAFALPFLVLSLGNLVMAQEKSKEKVYLRRALLWSLPLVFVKEDMGMTVLMIGLVTFIRTGWLAKAKDDLFPRSANHSQRFGARIRKSGSSLLTYSVALEAIATMLWGVVWSLMAMAVILPYFNTAGQFDYADKVNLETVLADPLQAMLTFIYPWQKTLSLLLLLLVGVILWVCSPLALITLPTLAWRFLSSTEGYWESTWHYSLVLMPVVFLALLGTVVSPPQLLARLYRRFSFSRVTAILGTITLLVALMLIPFQPLKELANSRFTSADASASDQAKQEVVEAIPDGTVAAADLSVLTYLIPHHTVYWIGHSGEPAPDYVVIDKAGSAWGANPPQNPVDYATQRYNSPYVLDRQVGSIYIVRKLML